MRLDEIYYHHIISKKEKEKVRDPHRLFVTDLGKCHRMLAYRLTGATEDVDDFDYQIRREIMFEYAEHMESMMAEAFKLQGKLIAYQLDIEFPDRENWGGRLDFAAAYKGRRIIEWKTVLPNAIKKVYDYPHFDLQAKCYDYYCKEKLGLTDPAIVAVFPRGSTEKYVEHEVDVDDATLISAMDGTDLLRRRIVDRTYTIDDVPRLSKVVKERDYGKTLKLEPHWWCTRCNYWGTCKPDMSKPTLATRERDTSGMWKHWERKKAALDYPEFIEEYINRTLESQ